MISTLQFGTEREIRIFVVGAIVAYLLLSVLHFVRARRDRKRWDALVEKGNRLRAEHDARMGTLRREQEAKLTVDGRTHCLCCGGELVPTPGSYLTPQDRAFIEQQNAALSDLGRMALEDDGAVQATDPPKGD